MKKWSAPKGVQGRSQQTASAILWALHMGGPVESAGGQATKMLERRMRALKLWNPSASRNYLYVASHLASPEWGQPIERISESNGRCVRIVLRLDPDALPTPPVGWSAKDAILQMETITATEIDQAARNRTPAQVEGRWTWPAGIRDTSREAVRAILWTLHDLGGTVRSPEGYAPSVLLKAVEKRVGLKPTDTMRYLLGRLYDESGKDYYGRPVLARQGTDRSSTQIKLLVSRDDLPLRPSGMVSPEPPAAPAPPPPPPPPPPRDALDATQHAIEHANMQARTNGSLPLVVRPEEDLDPIDLVMAAQRLLTEAVLQIASRPVAEPAADHDVVLRRLSDALEENQRLRRRVSEAELGQEARTKEIDTLRRLLAESTANLDALRGPAAAKAKEIEKMMRQRPKVR